MLICLLPKITPLASTSHFGNCWIKAISLAWQFCSTFRRAVGPRVLWKSETTTQQTEMWVCLDCELGEILCPLLVLCMCQNLGLILQKPLKVIQATQVYRKLNQLATRTLLTQQESPKFQPKMHGRKERLTEGLMFTYGALDKK